jgi:hypothetical protein
MQRNSNGVGATHRDSVDYASGKSIALNLKRLRLVQST